MLEATTSACHSQGKLTSVSMKKRLGAFYRNLPAKEIKLLLGDAPFTKEELKKLLSNNNLGKFDPTAEAFKAYDPNGTGYVDTGTLRSIFEQLGYGEITDEDLAVLVRAHTHALLVNRAAAYSVSELRLLVSPAACTGGHGGRRPRRPDFAGRFQADAEFW